MEKYIDVIKKCPLFKDINSNHLLAMLKCLGAQIQSFTKNQDIMCEGTPATHIGIVLSGQAQLIQIDYYGNRNIITCIEPAQLFGESFACAETESLPINVTATCDTDILLINCRRITQACSNACSFHSQIIFNLMKVVATKNLLFNQKIEITSKRSTKEKLIAFLLNEAKKNQSNSFTIPYDRQELADYLGVERSGLSSEIGKLRKAGFIEDNKKNFTILQKLTN